MKWNKKSTPHLKKQCDLNAEVILPLQENHSPYDVFTAVTNLDQLLQIIVDESNRYAQQKGREFQTNVEEMRAFLGINFIMTINKLPTIKSYWQCNQFLGNEGIRSVISRTRFEEILRNLHFADNNQDDKTDKAYKDP